MCGIVGFIGKDKAIKAVISGLESLEYRGYDSAGIAYLKDNKINICKEQGRIKNLKDKLDMNIKSDLSIGHTRWATHGKANSTNAHPHRVGKITIVHNGIIENYQEIKNKLISEGYKFKSETDTEVACALIDYYYDGNIISAINNSIKVFKGSFALGIIVDGDKNLYAVRKTSPLIIGLNDDEFFISSDVPAILKYTNKYILLDDLEIAKINKEVIFYNNLKEIKKEILTYDNDITCISKGKYDHFMLKEINEQPEVIEKTINNYFNGDIKSLQNSFPNLKKYKEIHIVACGSAYHAGLVGKTLIEKYANVKVTCEIASEYRYKNNFYDKNTLVIVVSQSGETADTLAALNKANEDGIDTLAIVNVYKSSIARSAKYVIYTKAGNEIAVATTKAYSCQIAIFILLTIYLGYKNNYFNDSDIKNLYNELISIPNKINDLIKQDYKNIALEIYKSNNIFFIGRSIDYALSLEGSLKLKEISYINSVAYQAGELKHGSISLIDKKTPVIAIATDEHLYEKTISNIKETKARGSFAILISTFLNNDFDHLIKIPKTNYLLTPLLVIIPLQLIAYEVAKLKGCDIDKPRNLAKSVTVE